MSLTPEDIDDILRVLDGTDIGELELSTARFRLILRRDRGGWTQQSQVRTQPHLVAASPPPDDDVDVTDADTGGDARQAAEGQAVVDGLVDVRTPLMGTFYRAPKPGAPPFVDVGSHVQPDTVVALIETMKLFSSIYAGVGGRVTEICLEDAAFADQDAVVMRIDPEAG